MQGKLDELRRQGAQEDGRVRRTDVVQLEPMDDQRFQAWRARQQSGDSGAGVRRRVTGVQQVGLERLETAGGVRGGVREGQGAALVAVTEHQAPGVRQHASQPQRQVLRPAEADADKGVAAVAPPTGGGQGTHAGRECHHEIQQVGRQGRQRGTTHGCGSVCMVGGAYTVLKNTPSASPG